MQQKSKRLFAGWEISTITLVAVDPHQLKLPSDTKKWFELERV